MLTWMCDVTLKDRVQSAEYTIDGTFRNCVRGRAENTKKGLNDDDDV